MISKPTRAASKYISDLFRNGTPAALDDAELLNRFASRQNEHDETAELAFGALLARHGPMVLRVCRGVLGDRHEVENAFQATFLVLAVRARSIRRLSSVASWLHGVALRVAAAERSRAARRRRHELVRSAMTSFTTHDEGSAPVCDNEQNAAIQEEIGCLPEKYRAPVVLCYLEGLTHEMAAEHLGWPVGSVKSRLAWARRRLRMRLTRRGLAPTVLALDRDESPRDAGPAPVLLGTRLVDATLRGCLKAGTGKAALTGIVSAEAAALMETIVTSLTRAKLLVMTATLLMAGLAAAGAGVMGYSVIPQEYPPRAGNAGHDARGPAKASPATQREPRAAAANSAADQGPLIVQVQVVDRQGRRLAGADVVGAVYYVTDSGRSESVFKRMRTDGAGQAQFEVARERPAAYAHSASFWAYQPGLAIAVASAGSGGSGLFVRKASPFVVPLTLDEPAKCTITVVGPDDRPIAGLRLTPTWSSERIAATSRPFPMPCASR